MRSGGGGSVDFKKNQDGVALSTLDGIIYLTSYIILIFANFLDLMHPLFFFKFFAKSHAFLWKC